MAGFGPVHRNFMERSQTSSFILFLALGEVMEELAGNQKKKKESGVNQLHVKNPLTSASY